MISYNATMDFAENYMWPNVFSEKDVRGIIVISTLALLILNIIGQLLYVCLKEKDKAVIEPTQPVVAIIDDTDDETDADSMAETEASEPMDLYTEDRTKKLLLLNSKIIASRSKVVELWFQLQEFSKACDNKHNNVFRLEIDIEKLATQHNVLEFQADKKAEAMYSNYVSVKKTYDDLLLEIEADKKIHVQIQSDLDNARNELYTNSQTLYEYITTEDQT